MNLDFEIVGAVWRHNRVFKPGQEKALVEAGFTASDRKTEIAKGNVLDVEIPLSVSDGARELAEKEGVDLAKVEGSGPAGRIYQKDVEGYLSE